MSLQQAWMAFENGDYREARQFLDQAGKGIGEEAVHVHLEGLIQFKEGNYTESVATFSKAIEMDAQQADFYSDRAVALFRMRKAGDAIIDFERAIELEPKNGYRYACRAFIRSKMGNVEGAIADYEKALELDPKDEISRNNLEMAQEQLQYQSRTPKFKTKAHFSDAEIEKYKTAYQRKQAAKQLPRWKQYGHLIKQVFTSRSRFRDFWRFVSRGF